MSSADPKQVAATRLRERKQRILERWVERVQKHLDSARSTSRPELIDSLPLMMDRMAAALEGSSEALIATEEPEEHGKHRAELTPYSLEELVIEYQLLRDVTLEIIDEDGPLDALSHDVISDMVLVAIAKSAGTFSKQRHLKTERELFHTDTRFKHMVEAVKDYAIFTLDPDGYITTWNLGCIRMKRYTPEEVVGQHFSMLYPADGKRRDEPEAHLRTAAIEGRFRGEGMRLRKETIPFLADVSITPIYEGGKVIGYTKVVQDLTERNMMIQERDLSRTDAERLRLEAEYRDRFVTALTHDLRSPLATAKTAAELIAQAPDDVKVRSWSARIDDALSRVDRMISDLLDASQMDAGLAPALEFSHCDVKEIAEELLDELRTRHGDRFRIDAHGDTRGFWSADGLRRVLDNLLSNAIKYGDANRPITVRLRRADDHELISVHNFGTIIPIEELENLFRAFHRAPIAKHSGMPGWGIGLTLVKGIAEAHGGIVKAESYPIEGTTFTVDLPINGAAAARP